MHLLPNPCTQDQVLPAATARHDSRMLPATAVSAACVVTKDCLDDVVTYLRAGQMPPQRLRQIADGLLGLATQMNLHADAKERDMLSAAALDGSEL